MSDTSDTLRLAFPSHLDMLDFVQLFCDHASRVGNLDEESGHGVGVSVRESVVNAIKHGNTGDETKRVVVEFRFEPIHAPARLVVRVMDQGRGFDLVDVADPCAPEKPPQAVRARSALHALPHGQPDLAARTRRRDRSPDGQEDRLMAVAAALLQTAIEIVVRAGAIQTAEFGRTLEIGKKGPIDLVTQVDVAIERMCRETVAARFPDHTVLAEELPECRGGCRRPEGPPLDLRSNRRHGELRARTADLLRVAGARNRRPGWRWGRCTTQPARSCSSASAAPARG